MIKVLILHEDKDHNITEIGALKFNRIEPTFDEAEYADYELQLVASNGEDVMIRSRWIKDFPRTRTNVLGLIRVALMELKPEDYRLVGDCNTPSGYMARRFHRAMQTLSDWTNPLRDSRPAIRGGQPVQHGGDAGGQGVRDEDPERRDAGAGDRSLQGGDGLPSAEDHG